MAASDSARQEDHFQKKICPKRTFPSNFVKLVSKILYLFLMNYTENPTRKSYKEQTLAQHMVTRHPDLKPDLEFEILFIERNTLLRKIKEAYCIRTLGPTLNEKKEMKSLEKFML